MEESSIIFITGGVRSGKSRIAEEKAIQIARSTKGKLHYIATGIPSDEEMKGRIDKHQQQRLNGTCVWHTWEQPCQINQIAHHFNQNDIVLLDCLTILVNNEIFMDQEEKGLKSLFYIVKEGMESIAESCHSLIIVSNEVLNEPLQDNELIIKYKRLIGTLHQYMVQRADQVYLVESGIPLCMRGSQL